MSAHRAHFVQRTTDRGGAARWDENGPVIRSLVSRRMFQIQFDAEGIVRSMSKDGDHVHEVLLADVIADARERAGLLRAQAQDEAYAGLAPLVRQALHHLARALEIGVANSPAP